MERLVGTLRRWVGRTPVLGALARWARAAVLAGETRRRLAETEAALQREIEARIRMDAAAHRAVEEAEQRLAALEARWNEEIARAAQELAAARLALARAEAKARLAERIPAPQPAAETSTNAPPAPPVAPSQGVSAHWDAAFLAMSEATRGAREDIKRRQAVHLPRLLSADPVQQGLPVLDLGCGRGELLELLREHNIPARGIDASPAAVALCQSRGLPAEQGDALAFLAAQPDASWGAIALFHLIEHFTIPEHTIIFDQAFRILAPGGILFMETPNCEILLVAGRNFWIDPTHKVQHMPGSLFRWFEAAGFVDIAWERLHPTPPSLALPNTAPGAEILNSLLFGPQDFAIWGYRPR